ncbi:hypothetical protein GCM10010435_27170 [Winogradskya consettensis]|uniref:Uncharacterized protein n=1 Tax=Winogradskya consettensis TaxID=113560 RepID=A0A919SAX4_9ACTN|nr:hypothetical protein [Actinoplanes consettensis]GIM68239.1 hypothetical protein Aco04nite_09960 [Actinoplanes consettensis]
MPDLVVKDLDGLVSSLNELIGQFEGALDFQDDEKDQWGQLNANLSMGDFADNWTVHRNKLVEEMKKFRDKVKELDETWTEAEKQMRESMDQK